MQTSQFIEELASGNASVAKDILNDMLSTRAFESLDAKKIELARNMFNGSEVEESQEEEEVEITQEEFDQLDEISKKTATSAYVARMGREDDKSPDKAVKTMDRIYKKHGATGVMRAATAADKKYGIHSADYTKKDFVGDYLSSKGK